MYAARLSDYSNLIFHIGVHKTGTSYLQSVLRANTALLRQTGIHYPEYRDPLRAEQANGNHSLAVQKCPGQTSLWSELSEMLHLESDCDTLLISAEEFARKSALENLTDRLRIEAPETPVQFIIYLRRYDQLLESAYAQSVRGKYSGPITECGYNMKFRSILQRIASQTGLKSLAIRPYNQQLWPDGSLGRDFMATLGLSGLWDQLQMDTAAVVNQSLPRIQTYVLSCLTSPQAKRAMMDYFKVNPPKTEESSRYFYSPPERQEINRFFLEEDRAFLTELGIDDPESFLDSNAFPDAADWTPFQPEQVAISQYLTEFIDWRLSPRVPPDKP